MKLKESLHQMHAEATHWVATLLSALPLAALHWLALRYSEG